MRKVLPLLLISLATLLSAQNQQTFTCPSPLVQAACNSFRDSKTTLEFGDYVCFRENEDDQYFSIATGEDSLIWSESDPKNGNPTRTATAVGFILGWVTNHGVEDDSLSPGFEVQGVWHSPSGPYFVQSPQNPENQVKVTVSSVAITVDQTFTNIKNKKTTYHLTIDRATNRFLESLSSVDLDAYQKSYGRCITGRRTSQ